ncbi:MAG: permease [Treponema sp.]|jgi:putative hydroxymethylpyrimidine transporter CytX|nr:permease [Treponema sp.]
MKKSAVFLLWAGAAISISEIYTGGLLAPLGPGKAAAVILGGHVFGTGLLALGGYVSFARRRNAMDSAAFSPGSAGGKIAAFFNVAQLSGWTVIMVVQAAEAVTALFPALPFAPVSLALGVIVLVWALIFGSPAQWINNAAVILLSVLCAVLFWELRGRSAPGGGGASMSVAAGVELAIAMPVSWLPLIGDYSFRAESGPRAALFPFAGYFLASSAMYIFGLLAALSGGGDFFAFIAGSRFRLAACAVVILSTMTTAFLDLYSAAVSSGQFIKTKSPRLPILVMGIFAIAAPVFFPADKYGDFLVNFLSLTGMIFVPVYGVVFIDFFMKRPRHGGGKEGRRKIASALNLPAFAAVMAGMISYRLFTVYESGVPSLFSLAAVCIVYIPAVLAEGRVMKTEGIKTTTEEKNDH